MPLTPTTPALPSPTDRAGVSAAPIPQRTPSCHRRLSLALGRRRHRLPASTARLPPLQLVTSLLGARTWLPRPDALSSVLEGHLSQPTNKGPEDSSFERRGKLQMTRDIRIYEV